MSGGEWVQLWLAVTVCSGLLLVWPAPHGPERRVALRSVRYVAVIACGLYIASPAFPLTAERVGWPWCVLDDLIASIAVIWCGVKSSSGPTISRQTVAQTSCANENCDKTMDGGC